MSEQTSEQPTSEAPAAKKKIKFISRLTKAGLPNKKEEALKAREIDQELKNIYQDSAGQMPNLTQLDFKPQNRKRNLIISLLLGLFIIFGATVAGFWIFKPSPSYSGNNINLEIKAPFTISSGDNIDYQIKLTDNEGVSLTNAKLTVNFPDGFIFINSNLPAQEATTGQNPKLKTWQINDIFPGQTQLLDINGTLIGAIGSNQVMSAALSYTPANFSSEFEKTNSFSTQINDSLAAITSEYTTQVANDEITEIKIKLDNKSNDLPLTDLEADLNFPAEFSLMEIQLLNSGQSAKPLDAKSLSAAKPVPSPQVTAISGLLPQEEKTIIYRGKFKVAATKNIDLNWQLKLKGPTGDYLVQQDNKLSFEVINGELLTNLIIQGSNQDKAVNYGDNLNYLLSIENKSQKTLGDLKVRAVIDSPLIDWNSLTDSNKGVQTDNQILWTPDQIPGLANLLPGDEINISFQLKLKNLADLANVNPENLLTKSYFETQVNKINNADNQLQAESNTIVNQLNTDLAISSEGRYFGPNSETLGSGPLPPIVGQKTTYKIFWKLTNSLHDISNIIVKAKLPDYVNYESQENLSTGDLTTNKNNEVVWQISGIPSSVHEATATFSISLTPSSSDAGKILTLLQEGALTATDTQTKGLINLTVSGVTTDLDSDPLGKGKGLIQAQ